MIGLDSPEHCDRCGPRGEVPSPGGSRRRLVYCAECDAARQRLVAAQEDDGPPRFRGVIPLIVDVAGAENPMRLIALEAWERWFELRIFEVVPPIEVPAEVRKAGIGGWFAGPGSLRSGIAKRWIARTAAGTEHEGFVTGGGGGDGHWWGTVRFHPALPDECSSVDVTFGPRGAEVAIQRIQLTNWPAAIRHLVARSSDASPTISEAGCSRCGAATYAGRKFCPACRETVDQTVDAYSRPTRGPFKVIPLNAELGTVLGSVTTLLSLELSRGWFNLRYHLHPWAPERGGHEPPMHRRYEALDDQNRRYRGFGNSASGSAQGWTADVAFSPELHPDARALVLSLKAPDESDLFSVDVPLR